jgi:thioredoxin-related protein
MKTQLKQLSIAGIFCMMAFSTLAQKGMTFETGTFADIKAKAKRENKLIFMDCYTTWCGPCKTMARETFTQQEVGNYFNPRFVNAKFDMEEDGDGTQISREYEIMCYPNLLVLDADGNLLHRASGYKDAEEFIEFAKTAQDPSKRFMAVKADYEQNKNNKEKTLQYLTYLGGTCLSTEDVAKNYLSMLTESDYKDPQNWSVLNEYATDFNGAAFRYIAKNWSDFVNEHSADDMRDYAIKVLYTAAEKMASDEKSTEEVDAFLREARGLNIPSVKNEDLFDIKLFFLSKKEAWADYIATAMEGGDQLIREGSVNQVCWNIFLHGDERIVFQKATGWMKKYITEKKPDYDWVMGISKTVPKWLVDLGLPADKHADAKAYLAEKMLYSHYDTYASLLFKLKNKKEAQKYADLAIGIAKKYELDYESTQDLLNDIKKLK